MHFIDIYHCRNQIACLNNFDSEKFDEVFDVLEMAYYDELILRDPNKKIYAKGWKKRALAV